MNNFDILCITWNAYILFFNGMYYDNVVSSRRCVKNQNICSLFLFIKHYNIFNHFGACALKCDLSTIFPQN